MANLSERVERRIKEKADRSVTLVKQGLQEIREIREMIDRVNTKNDALQSLETNLEKLLQSIEQDVKKL